MHTDKRTEQAAGGAKEQDPGGGEELGLPPSVRPGADFTPVREAFAAIGIEANLRLVDEPRPDFTGERALMGITAVVRAPASESGGAPPRGAVPRAVRELLVKEVHRRASALCVGARGTAATLRELVEDVARETLELLAGAHVTGARVLVELREAGEGAASAECTIAFGGAS